MQVNAILSSTDTSGKKQTTTITYLRASQKAKAVELATALNALTTNTYTSTQVNEINVDLTGKTQPTLTLGTFEADPSVGGRVRALITYSGNGQLSVSCTNPAFIQNSYLIVITSDSSSFSGTIYATETDYYSSAKVEFNRS